MSQPWDEEFRTAKKRPGKKKKSRLRRVAHKAETVVGAMALVAMVYVVVAIHTVKLSRN